MGLAVFTACSPPPVGPTQTFEAIGSETISPSPSATLISSSTPSVGATLTLNPRSSLGPTPSPETLEIENQPSSRIDRYQNIYYNEIPPALEWILVGEYSRAIAQWNQIIADLPGYGYAYYQRGRSYYLYALQSSVQAETLDGLKLALEDANTAIESGPPLGDIYILRYKIYTWLARLEPVRDEGIKYLEMALLDARQANLLGNSDPVSSQYPGLALIGLGRCQDALDEFAHLFSLGANNSKRADLNEDLARSYLCFGALDEALTHINLALAIQPTMARQMVKAIILFTMGQLEQAKTLLDDWIENEPAYYPERYFFRALIDYDLRLYDQARSDLENGLSLNYDLRGVGAYVKGLLALQDGEKVSGQELIEFAEQSIDFGYGPLLNRIRGDLGLPRLNFGAPRIPTQIASILTATPVIPWRPSLTEEISINPILTTTTTATITLLAPTVVLPLGTWTALPTETKLASPTPMPTSTRISTPTPHEFPTHASTVTPLPAYTRSYTVTPYPTLTPLARAGILSPSGAEFSQPPKFVFRDLTVPYSGGGSFTLGVQHGGLTLFFYTQESVDLEKVDSFTVTLELADDTTQPDLFFQLFRYEGSEILQGGEGLRLAPGENEYAYYSGFVQRDGGVFVRLINRSGKPIDIESLGLSLSAQLTDGSYRVLGVQLP
jgi:tetratricopeptide (TPR) repeat protein